MSVWSKLYLFAACPRSCQAGCSQDHALSGVPAASWYQPSTKTLSTASDRLHTEYCPWQPEDDGKRLFLERNKDTKSISHEAAVRGCSIRSINCRPSRKVSHLFVGPSKEHDRVYRYHGLPILYKAASPLNTSLQPFRQSHGRKSHRSHPKHSQTAARCWKNHLTSDPMLAKQPLVVRCRKVFNVSTISISFVANA